MKFIFLPPRKKEIALFDAEGLKDARYILNKNSYEIIYCRKEKINIFKNANSTISSFPLLLACTA